ncbi:MAG: tRNA (uridine(34)/cytosine(34)/5-carboxymethylaminomethyluridine(34)-2'-O)-methyltransferase TrmL [Ruminococcaceae bacterium]|nr:tRNA (uridine(34)/cytosine(34)/5-carboxymethylaminomethyluridine(34)-2'-O)-methyltransferase TrmL [Oscillospiraceae bacterium]
MAMNIVLVEPEIPQNTGNIARTCKATGSVLHIVKPMGFAIDDKKLKRAGLDYWYELDIRYYENISDFFEKTKGGNYYFCSTKSKHTYCEVSFSDGDYLVFGKETRGLNETLLKENYEKCIRIPMTEDARSLNLSNSVAIVLYEALRQIGFKGLWTEGELSGREEPDLL